MVFRDTIKLSESSELVEVLVFLCLIWLASKWFYWLVFLSVFLTQNHFPLSAFKFALSSTSTRLEVHTSSVGPWPSEWAHLNSTCTSQLGPSSLSLNWVPQLGPSTWSLNWVPQLGPSTESLNCVPQLCPSTWGPSTWSFNLVPQLSPSTGSHGYHEDEEYHEVYHDDEEYHEDEEHHQWRLPWGRRTWRLPDLLTNF